MMVKRIKFPLEMADGIKVRTIEELRENFNIEKILEYFIDGKLITWLNDRYYEGEAEQVINLSNNDSDIVRKLCGIFDVEYIENSQLDIQEIQLRKQKLERLKQFTDDENVLINVDSVAFNQEELADLLDEDCSEIYLCGDRFIIPLSKEGITYIGVNNPIVVIKSKTLVDFSSKNILIKNIRYDEAYQELINDNIKTEKEKSNFVNASYKPSAPFDSLMNSKDRRKSLKLFDIISKELSELNYDIDKNTK